MTFSRLKAISKAENTSSQLYVVRSLDLAPTQSPISGPGAEGEGCGAVCLRESCEERALGSGGMDSVHVGSAAIQASLLPHRRFVLLRSTSILYSRELSDTELSCCINPLLSRSVFEIIFGSVVV